MQRQLDSCLTNLKESSEAKLNEAYKYVKLMDYGLKYKRGQDLQKKERKRAHNQWLSGVSGVHGY